MAYFEEGSEALTALEEMIDKAGARNVAYAVARVCSLKAQHVSDNWQDANLAREWDRSATAWEKFAAKCPTSPLD